MKVCIVTSVLFALLFFDTNAQSRVDRENVQFELKSEKLTQASGWKQNQTTGKWIENQNVIADRGITPQARGVSQNFNWLQFANLTFEGEQYYLLVYERPTGRYRYPNIRQGWSRFESVYFFVFTSEQYYQIVNSINLMSGETINIKSNMAGEYSGLFIQDAGGYDEKDLLARITNILKQPHYFENCFRLNSQVVEGLEIIRFRIPEACVLSEDKIQTAYFEVNFKDFYSLLKSVSGDLDLTNLPETSIPQEEKKEEYFIFVDEMPELIGGLEEIQKQINYPEMAKRAGIEGRVYVQFIVNKQGEVENPVVVRGIGGGADEEALRVVKQAKFKPGLQRGKPVRVEYSLPVLFRLQND